MDGWIKLYRKSVDNIIYFSEPFTRWQAWTDLLIIANHKTGMFFKRGIQITVETGQVGYDLDTLAKRWKWSRGKCERFFLYLETSGQIVRQKNNVSTLITIINYKDYQTNDKANDKASSKADDKANGKQTDTNKNDKNNKETFNIFWNHYHSITKLNKTDYKAAFKYWDKMSLEEQRSAYKNVKSYYESLNDKKYCKKARTYLSDKNFNDEFENNMSMETFPEKYRYVIKESINNLTLRQRYDYKDDPELIKWVKWLIKYREENENK